MRLPLFLAALALPLAAPAYAALNEGARAPDFTTDGAIAGKSFHLHLAEQLKKGPVVLYFFPAAFTGGCNAEAKAFAQSIDKFKAAGATVIGMSADSVPQLKKFSTAHCAGKFAVANASPKVIADYDVSLGQTFKTPEGVERAVTDRTSYVIAPDGTIIYAHSDMSPAGHITGTLAAVRKWRADHPR
ncbi:redoxin domain-containing protein [Sphingomonadaceae bacterium LXI357]|uniref:thioredoxin-dependent peroxiredoxin n=2 Tax=Stakelama marina TaxID=2826939 RepID=A0A8T4IH42_9SPHN|nr:redoxin domain-containing protein [Stakelama marina]MBR0553204.1 redoxin domain-containing protein [Stakelama marina]